MAVVVWIFLLNFLLLSKCAFLSPLYIDTVIGAVDNMIEYYKNNYQDLNVDGLFGLRVIEGHLAAIIVKVENGTIKQIKPNMIEKLKSMKTVSTKTCEDALDFVRKDDEEYFQSMKFLLGNPWSLHKDYKHLQFQLLWDQQVYKKSSVSSLNEKESDKCMMEIMGYQPSKKKCGVSPFCIELMTRKGLTGYGITHQMLWTMLSEQAGCYEELSNLLVTNGRGQTHNIQLEFCTNNYLEMMHIVHGTLKGQIIPRFQDLFMEQQFVCPSLGFYQFLSDNFLDQILSWQKDVGCYGIMKKVELNPAGLKKYLGSTNYDYEDSPVHKLLKFQGKLSQNITKFGKHTVNVQPPVLNLAGELNTNKNLGNVQMTNNVVMQNGPELVAKGSENVVKSFSQPKLGRPGIEQKSVFHGQRMLLAEKEMENGCLAHKTAVAAGALMIYLRYLLLPGPKTLAENTKEMLQQRHLLNINDSGVDKFDYKGAQDGNLVKGLAMNNNVLAAQINDNNKDDDYYADENEEDEDENDEDDEKGGNKNVQFDDHQNEENGYEGDYDENKKEKNLKVKNLADIVEKKVVPKPDDTDYTYYEDKNKHDDYTNDEYDEKDINVDKDNKDSASNKIKVKLINESKAEGEYLPSSTHSPSGVYLIISCTIFVLMILMYRFLKKRRVHIRYNYKSFNRV
ncbi:uncharacterized protein LOC134712135 [Mytilus trossulus]|uniref:uncharacterized protein LOC134712135 n=1 Tax=Mytilus trossulus TaxID=6551 RepID=UPI003005B0EE